MQSWKVGVVMLGCAGWAFGARAQSISGEMYLRYCGPDAPLENRDGCDLGMERVVRRNSTMLNGYASHPLCAPEQVSDHQMVLVVERYLRLHPEHAPDTVDTLAVEALLEAFACSK